MAKQYVAPPPATPVCYYLDWVAQTCYISRSEAECTTIAQQQKEVSKSSLPILKQIYGSPKTLFISNVMMVGL
jgi:hypothetical protein